MTHEVIFHHVKMAETGAFFQTVQERFDHGPHESHGDSSHC